MPDMNFPVFVLIASNLVPLFGVFVLDWSVASILILYWTESVILGVLNIPKILATKDSLGGKIFICVFFAIHFGGFCAGHAFFIADIFKARAEFQTLLTGGPLLIASLTFFVSHFVSMMVNYFGKKEYEGRDANTQMFMPYGRIIIMHVVILIGGALAMLLGAPVIAVLFLIALKTVIDLLSHGAEHGKWLEVQQMKD